MDPEGDCDILFRQLKLNLEVWKSSMDPEGDCDKTTAGVWRRRRPPPWKSSMDPEGDCDSTLINSSALPAEKKWKRSMGPEGDCGADNPPWPPFRKGGNKSLRGCSMRFGNVEIVDGF